VSAFVLCAHFLFHYDHDDADDGHNPKPNHGDVIHPFHLLTSWSTADSICMARQKLKRRKTKICELKNELKEDRNY